MIKRREFITLVGGVAAWPLAARAQQPPMPVVGFLRSGTLADVPHWVTAFRQGLTEAGFVEGQNVAIEFRSAEHHPDRLRALVADLIRRPVAVIVGNYDACSQGRNHNGSDRVRDRERPSQGRPRGQPKSPGWQRYWRGLFLGAAWGKATGAVTPARA
jgi:hypothetical protein